MNSAKLIGQCVPILQVLHRSKTLEPAVDHDGHSGAESFTFLHTENTCVEKQSENCTTVQTRWAKSTIDYPPSIRHVHRPLPVWGKNYSSSLFGDTEDAVPQKPFGFWVHSSRGLILKTRAGNGSVVKQLNTKHYSVTHLRRWETFFLTRNMTGGAPIRAMAVESFLLLPPLYPPASRSAYWVSPSFFTPHCATCRTTSRHIVEHHDI